MAVHPFSDAICEIKNNIEAWINSKVFQDLIATFGWNDQSNKPLQIRIDNLVKQSDEWDFRRRTSLGESMGAGNRESTRWTSNDELLSKSQSSAALQAADLMQLSRAVEPLRKDYRAILILGGARLSCLLRSKRAAEIIQSGVSTNEVVMLGSERPVSDSERDATDVYAVNAINEFDLFVSAGAATFGFEITSYFKNRYDDPNPNLSWEIREYVSRLIPRVSIISAPSSAPKERRANSADTYRFCIERLHMAFGDTLLLVTSQIYVPYQQMEALRVIAVPLGIHVETVGFPPEWYAKLQGMQGPQHYLQEMRSFLQSSQRFLTTYKE